MAHAHKTPEIEVKRIYEKPAASDGARVLVDRLWPRGVRKDNAALAHWFREVAPSNELRRWFGHDPKRWEEFRRRYTKELEAKGAEKDAELAELHRLAKAGRLTLLYGAHDEAHNQAVVLRDFLLAGD
jgi:uncharacterized protein YeaO (DUF488 family)